MAIRCLIAGVLAASVVWLGGCAHAPAAGPVRIDGSSPVAFQASWERMHQSLTRQQQAQLDVAVLPIALGSYRSFKDVPPSLLAGMGPLDHSGSGGWDDLRADRGVGAQRAGESEYAGEAVTSYARR